MPVLLVEDYEMADSALAGILMRGGYAVLGPAPGLEEAISLLGHRNARLALIRLSAIGHIGLPSTGDTLLLAVGAAITIAGGRIPVTVPDGLELF